MDNDTYDSTSVCVCGRSKGWARVKIIANAHPHTDVSYFVIYSSFFLLPVKEKNKPTL